MLARVAESLYWIGRNIERYEHCTRYLKVQYFSTLDAPMSQNKDFTLRSILFMSGSDFDTNTVVQEREVWRKVIFDINNPDSLFRLTQNARENARSIRNNISSELWEAINKWYLYNKNLNRNTFSSADIFSFSEQTISHIALVKYALSNTLIHNDAWNFICLGVYVERASQVLRILRSKISDSIILSSNGVNIPLMQYQWTILLKSLEAFDVYKNQHKTILRKESIFELVLNNDLFPRSLKYSANKIKNHISRISVRPEDYDTVLADFNNSMDTCLTIHSFEEEEDVINSITEANECVARFHDEIEALYFQ